MRRAQVSPYNLAKYCTCYAKSLACLILVAYDMSFTTRGATRLTIQLHQILRLPRKMNLSTLIRLTYETSFTMRGASKVTLQPHQVLPLPRNSEAQDFSRNSEQKIVISHPPLRRPYPSHRGDAFSTEKYNVSRSGYLPKCHEMLRLPRKVTLQLLRLPRKMNLSIDPLDIWNVIYNARSKQGHPPTSPSTAPATKFWSSRFQPKLPEALPLRKTIQG